MIKILNMKTFFSKSMQLAPVFGNFPKKISTFPKIPEKIRYRRKKS